MATGGHAFSPLSTLEVKVNIVSNLSDLAQPTIIQFIFNQLRFVTMVVRDLTCQKNIVNYNNSKLGLPKNPLHYSSMHSIIQIHNNVLWEGQCYVEYSHIQTEYEEYSTRCCQSQITLLWMWIMPCGLTLSCNCIF